MKTKETRVLLIAEESKTTEELKSALEEYYSTETERAGTAEFTTLPTLAEGIERLADDEFDIIIADLDLSDARGLMVFATLYAQAPELPIIVLVQPEDELLALKAVQHGAQDYIIKDQIHAGLVARATQHAIQQRATEEALARERERLAVTLRSIDEGLITVDIEGRIGLLNRAAEELTGWSQEEAEGQRLDEVFHTLHETTESRIQPPLTELLAGSGRTDYGTAILRARDGTKHLIALTGAPLREREGTVTGAVLTFRDIAAERQLQEERLRADKLEAIGKLAGGIAHDFNNLLVGIVGNLSLARGESIRPNDRSALLEEAEAAALRARALARQLLTFATGGAPIKERMTGIADLVADLLERTLRGSDLEVDLRFDSELWPVEIDPAQIDQALTHLVENARYATGDRGRLTISCKNLSEGDAHYLHLTVEDDGVGIRPEKLPQIFDPYYTTREDAPGLGLAVAHSIINRHEGRITVESRPGRGTSFQIYLPARPDQIPAREREEETGPEEGEPIGSRILLMDDDEMVRSVATRMLEVLGYETTTANDGAEAIELYQRGLEMGERFHLVIMDLTVPKGMGGREAMAEIRRIDPDARAIVSSGYSNDPVMSNYREYGFDGVLTKPYLLEDMKRVITPLLAQEGG